MDTKQIVEKALKGEDYSSLMTGLKPEEQAQAMLAIRDAADSESRIKLEAVRGLREAEKKITEENLKKNAAGVSDIFTKFKSEQIQKAKDKFFSDTRFSLSEEDKKVIESEIDKKGIDSADSDFIFNDIKKIYGSLKVDQLIIDKEKAVSNARSAEEWKAGQAGGNVTVNSPDTAKYSQATVELFRQFQAQGFKKLTIDDAKKMIENPGLTRKL